MLWVFCLLGGFFFGGVTVWMIPRKMFQCSVSSHSNTTFEETRLLVEGEWALGLPQNDSDPYVQLKGSADLRISPVFRDQMSLSCGIFVEKDNVFMVLYSQKPQESLASTI